MVDEKDISLFPYEWYLKDGYPAKGIEKNNLKVFSCFACGGGSSMGYKLAGYDVLGCNEIDKRMMNIYIENHHPKYSYLEPIQDFKNRTDLPEELYALDILDQSPPCFEAGSLVMTEVGFKTIENIKINDRVLTHLNRFQSVNKLMSKLANNYYELKIQGSLLLNVTGNHPFYTRRMNRKNKFGIRNFSEPLWKDLKDLSIIRTDNSSILEQDYIGIAINNNGNLPHYNGCIIGNKKINTLDFEDSNFWYLIGRWMGDGWIRIYENEDKTYRNTKKYQEKQIECLNCSSPSKRHATKINQWTSFCSVSCRNCYSRKMRKRNRYDFIICCGKSEFNELKNKVEGYTTKYTVVEERTVFKFFISSKELVKYVEQFGRGAKNKKLTNDILDLPIDLLKNFLEGYLDSDGYYNVSREKYSCCSVSKELILGIQHCVHKVYKTPTSISIKDNSKYSNIIEGRVVNTNIAYNLQFFKTKRLQQHGFYEEGYMWVPFRKSTLVSKSLEVFNLSISEDESYTVNNFICHNCSSFSIAGARDKDWGKKKKFREGQAEQVLDTLFFDAIELVNKLKPKVALFENVKGLLIGNAKMYFNKILKELNKIDYKVYWYLLNAKVMGVPQARERVFFIAIRKDIHETLLKKKGSNDIFGENINLNMYFNQKEILFKEVSDENDIENNLTELYENYWNNSKPGDCVGKFESRKKLDYESIAYTLVSGHSNHHPKYKREINTNEILKIGTFPMDYNLVKETAQYLCGMSVPPVMMANIAHRLKKEIFDYL